MCTARRARRYRQELLKPDEDFVGIGLDLRRAENSDKQPMAIVRRGPGVNYKEDLRSPPHNYDVRGQLHRNTWPEVQAACVTPDFDENYNSDKDDEEHV